MTERRTKNRWGQALPYIFGGFLCLLTAVAASQPGTPWYFSVILPCVAMIIILSKRRIFRPNVACTDGEIVCRYVPWQETTTYMFVVPLPLMGIAMIAAARDPGNPAWMQPGGIILLGTVPLTVLGIVYPWFRSCLRISPSILTVRLGALGSKPIEIRRDQIESITVNMEYSARPQTEIAYRTADPEASTTATIKLGAHLTVRPINLVNALIAWHDAAIDDPDELLDLIEHVLRAKSMSDVTRPPSRSALEAQGDVPESGSDHE